MTLRRTPLYDLHVHLGARMVPFAGWEMPVQYASILEEYRAVREKGGIFDVSHMGEILVYGEKARESLSHVYCNDIYTIEPGQVQYGAILNANGGVVDDVTVYCFSMDRYMMVSNAVNYLRIAELLKKVSESGVSVEDRSDHTALLALQGPMVHRLLEDKWGDLPALKRFHFAEVTLAGVPLLISRTGYTGEDGYELYFKPEFAESLFTSSMEAGLTPAGLGARDLLRLEVLYPLWGHELNEEWTPLESGIGWTFKNRSLSLAGRERIAEQKESGLPGRVRPFQLTEAGVPREGYGVFTGEERIGEVLSGAHSPALRAGIGTVYVPAGREPGPLSVEVRGRHLGLKLLEGPFYRRAAR
ncbi:MAG: glycine cleavage system aminomethyltransferase GcvT [Spirochaetales bacterium]|nr:glycine cleavage system aminomethyltransferase GcvT [Spirochaetales bacterium]